MASSTLSSTAESKSLLTAATRFGVYYTPEASRCSVVYSREGDSDVNPVFLVEAICPPFLYNIPSFDVISVKLRQLKAVGCDEEGKETRYDIFVRCDDAVTPRLPALFMVKDMTIVKVLWDLGTKTPLRTYGWGTHGSSRCINTYFVLYYDPGRRI